MVTIPDKQEEAETELPPPYQDDAAPATESTSELPPDFSQAASSTAIPAPNTPLVPPTNFLTINRTNNAIKGTYSIDPTLPCPPGVKPSIGEGGQDLHLHLGSDNGSIDALIEIIRGPDAKGPARLEAISRNGSISLKIYDRQQNHFRLRAASTHGSVKVQIPSTFIGTVSTKLKHGSLKFSSAVQARLMTFSEHDGESRYFIGNYVESGYDGDETWLMDHLRIETEHGAVKVGFTDEDDVVEDSSKGKGKGKESGSSKGLFTRIFGS